MVLLAHLSDPHLTGGPLMAGPAAGLHAALGCVLGLATRPDAVVITGDLVERGDARASDQLAETVGISVVNLSVLKNDRARAVRFSTLAAICDALDCDVGDLLTRRPARRADS